MTQVLLSLSADPPQRVAVSRRGIGAQSEECVRLALRLREIGTASRGRALLFLPASRGGDASRLVHGAVAGLLELGEGPLLVMDLRTAPGAAFEALPWEDMEVPGFDDRDAGARDLVAVTRPFAARHDTVAYAASPEFGGAIDRAQRAHAFVLCIGDPVHTSVEALIAAGLCDSVVLAVTPGRTTRSDVRRTTEQLRRSRAQVAGFVVEPRWAEGEG